MFTIDAILAPRVILPVGPDDIAHACYSISDTARAELDRSSLHSGIPSIALLTVGPELSFAYTLGRPEGVSLSALLVGAAQLGATLKRIVSIAFFMRVMS